MNKEKVYQILLSITANFLMKTKIKDIKVSNEEDLLQDVFLKSLSDEEKIIVNMGAMLLLNGDTDE